jgi:hypothetical protein
VTAIAGGPLLEGFVVPDGWLLEGLPKQPDFALLSTPPPCSYFVTLDFRLRGYRNGYSTIGMLVGKWDAKRKKYGGRGWKQQLVDDAVEHLRQTLR